MPEFHTWLSAVAPLCAIGAATWLVSLVRRDVSIVDAVWSLFFLAAAAIYYGLTPTVGARAHLVLVLVVVWALRLSLYILWRNHGQGEDRRYRAIRARNQPYFALKSLYLVFGLQAFLAWVISLPLVAGISGAGALGALDYLGAALVLFGLVFETIADLQLAAFKSEARNRDRVLDTGLWRYTRHPNYFGEFCIWWGFFLIATAAGGWWSIPAPLLMSFLLLRVSGVALLERDIGERRPAYRRYAARTNAFFPAPPRLGGATGKGS